MELLSTKSIIAMSTFFSQRLWQLSIDSISKALEFKQKMNYKLEIQSNSKYISSHITPWKVARKITISVK